MKQKGMMKTNNSVSVTCTLNADDIITLIEDGELQDNGIVIGTTEPERKRVIQNIDDIE